MKLFKLLLEKTTQPLYNFTHKVVHKPDMDTDTILRKFQRKLKFSTTFSKLGGGTFTDAYKNDKSPGQTIKVGYSVQKNPHLTPEVKWAHEANKKASENPHLPRTHHITSIVGSNGTVHVTRMERLHPVDHLTSSEKNQMWHHMTGEEFDSQISHAPYSHEFADHADPRFKDSIGGTGHPATEHLQNAMKLINRVHSKLVKSGHEPDNVTIDMAGSNVMARRTPHGLQAVITDPLYDRSRRSVSEATEDTTTTKAVPDHATNDKIGYVSKRDHSVQKIKPRYSADGPPLKTKSHNNPETPNP